MVIKLFRHHWQLHFAILAAADLIFGVGAYWALHGYWSDLPATTSWLGPALLFSFCSGFCIAAMGLYSSRQRSGLLGVVLRALLAVAVGSVLGWATGNLFFRNAEAPFRDFMMAGAVLFVLCVLFRVLKERVVNEDWLKRKVLVYGAGKRAESVAQLRRRSDRRGFVILGFVVADGDEPNAELTTKLVPAGKTMRQFCMENSIDEIVVAMDDRRRGFPMHDLLDCRLDGVEVTELISFLERETGKLRLDVLNPSWMIFSEGFRRGRIHSVMERTLDLIASLALAIAAAPFMLLTAIAIKIEDGFGASVFYSQKRIGLYGRPFGVLKFRSMRIDAERDGKPQWATKNDSRVTKVGAFIRQTRIDELPQILNVVRGEMSFVGPRPERPEFVAQLSERLPYYRERHNVKPGVTGWAQLCYPYGSSEKDALEKLQYDLYYVKNHTLLFYLGVLIQTVEVIIWRKGAR